jgi:transposase-like protein
LSKEELIALVRQLLSDVIRACRVESTFELEQGEKFLGTFRTYQTEITRFTEDFNVPFDNNQAERDIRNTKVRMKVSGGFRSKKGAETFTKIGAVIGTAVKQRKSVIKTLKNLFKQKNKNVATN